MASQVASDSRSPILSKSRKIGSGVRASLYLQIKQDTSYCILVFHFMEMVFCMRSDITGIELKTFIHTVTVLKTKDQSSHTHVQRWGQR